MLQDRFGRNHTYLRISLTDNCNLRCFYCMPEEDYDFAPPSRLMQVHEIDQLAQLFVAQGVTKIRLTGGEPLVRKDAGKIIAALSQLPVQLTMTTNGTRIKPMLQVLLDSSIRSLNISLDTLHRDKFLFMTRRDQLHTVLEAVELLLSHGFHVKLNAVVIKDLNDNEINDFVALTQSRPLHVRFIEFMPFTGNRWSSNKVVTQQEILDIVGQKYDYQPLPGLSEDTAKAFHVAGHEGTFAIISTMTAPFCGGCNRIRLTADGKFKNCLFSKGETDLLTPLRAGEPVLPLIQSTVLAKAEALGGQFTAADFEQVVAANIDNRSMITIGG